MEKDCRTCGASGTVELDPYSGLLCCSECGVVVEDRAFLEEHQEGYVIERRGTLVVGDKGPSTHPFLHCNTEGSERWKAKKKEDALSRINGMVSLLRLRPDDAVDVQDLVNRATDGEWGTGRWIGVLVAACCYIVVRQNNIPLTMVEIASAADCDVFELGRMLNKVLGVLEISLPQHKDLTVFLEKLMASDSRFSKLSKEDGKKIISQCRVLLEWTDKWSVSTGRHRLPVVAATFFIISEANEISIGLEEIAEELHARVLTARKRYKEILEAFVKTAQKFSWGKNWTTKNISYNYGYMLRYLETSLKLAAKRKAEAGVEAEGEKKKPRVSPKSFVASETARCRRLAKAERAAQRISKARQTILGKDKDGTEDTEEVLDWEDIIIERLLLQGATAKDIEQGYYPSLFARFDKSKGSEISDQEISSYIYTKEEILQRIKLQKLMSSTWEDWSATS